MSNIKLPQYVWDDPREEEFPLPENWQVTEYNIAGYDRPAMNPDEIQAAVTSLIGMKPLREVVKGKKEVAILFDDMTRSTRASKIIPFVLEELAAAGIQDNQIRFIAAVANHHALDRSSMAKKLGDDIVARFPVYNHVPFMNTTEVGTTSFGTKASINSEVLYCDLKIAIGSVLPHVQYGFSGGSKIIIPGVASYETVTNHHSVTHVAWTTERRANGNTLHGDIDDNRLHDDAREIADMVGLDVLISCIINKWGETTALFAGAFAPTYTAAVDEARINYATTNTGDNGIVIANTYVKASEYNMAFSTLPAVSKQGGDMVIITNSPPWQVIHYLFDKFGKTIAGAGSSGHGPALAPHVNNLIIYTQYPEGRISERYAGQDKVLITGDWNEVIARLEKSHPDGAKVAVYPSADIQYFSKIKSTPTSKEDEAYIQEVMSSSATS